MFTALVFQRFTIMRRLKQRSDRGTTTWLCIIFFVFKVPPLNQVFPHSVPYFHCNWLNKISSNKRRACSENGIAMSLVHRWSVADHVLPTCATFDHLPSAQAYLSIFLESTVSCVFKYRRRKRQKNGQPTTVYCHLNTCPARFEYM